MDASIWIALFALVGLLSIVAFLAYYVGTQRSMNLRLRGLGLSLDLKGSQSDFEQVPHSPSPPVVQIAALLEAARLHKEDTVITKFREGLYKVTSGMTMPADLDDAVVVRGRNPENRERLKHVSDASSIRQATERLKASPPTHGDSY